MITYKQFKVIAEKLNNMSIMIGRLAANADYLNQQIQLLQNAQADKQDETAICDNDNDNEVLP